MTHHYDFRILIIDDNPEIHKDFLKILTTLPEKSKFEELDKLLFDVPSDSKKEILLPHFQIDTATQGKSGVEKIEKAIEEGNPYSLAFVDIRMPPGWDGVETVKHIWEIDKDIQIVICTAYSDYTWEETISELGQSDNLLILKKPFDQIAVRQLACAMTQKWKLAQEARSHTQYLEETIRERTEELQYLATHDPLTDLPNRVLLNDRLNKAIQSAKTNRTHMAVLFFDLDRFKLINDSLNHAAGDELLCSVSRRIKESIRDTDTLARIGGDEFVLVVNDFTNIENLTLIITELLKNLNLPHVISKHKIVVTSSIGIAVYPKDGMTPDQLIRNADSAMYHAKELGANQFQFYSEKMSEDSLRRLELENDLRKALDNKEFFLQYQPQIDLKQKKLISAEALLRWNHPEKGLLLPIDFIPIAEESGFILTLGEWVIREACKQNKKWQEDNLPKISISVNVTTPQIRDENFVEKIRNILNETKLSPEYLELELSENSIVNNKEFIKTFIELKKLGVHFAIDDFGTGYSSLSYLRNLPLDRLKIDKSFVQNIQINRGDEVLIHAIIAMAKSLNLEVLAEGVETQNQLNFLKSQNCDGIQGFYYSCPLSVNEFENMLTDNSNIKKVLNLDDTK